MHQQTTTTSVSLNAGVLRFDGEHAHIGREADFSEFVTLSDASTLHRAMSALHAFVKGFGSVRFPARDLAQQRLAQIRFHLKAA